MKRALQPLVSIVIVNYNGKAYLKECLQSLRDVEYTHIEILLVDNGSSDDSLAYVRRHFPSVKIIECKENSGFAGGNNIGMKKARGAYILMLNNDTKVNKNFIGELVNVFEHDKSIGAAQSKLLMMDDPALLDSVGAFQTPIGFLYHYGYAKKNTSTYEKSITLYSAKGACMMVRRDVLERILIDGDVFDKNYFAYFEETDLCHRIWLAGYKVVFVPTSIVLHKMGATSQQMDNAFVQFHSFKNRIHSYIKNYGAVSFLCMFPAHMAVCTFYFFYMMATQRNAVAMAIAKAVGWNIVNLRDTLRKRKIVQRIIRTRADRTFFPSIVKHPPLRYYFLLTSSLQNFTDIDVE